jgi:hypothetical protein
MPELPVEPMLDAPVLDEPMPDEPMFDEPIRDEPMRDESMPLQALSAATHMAESISFFIRISFERFSDAAPCGHRDVCHHHHG